MKIGLEVHVALPLKSKLFCRCSSSGTEPNTAICPICMGFPGSKPMLNEEALRIAKSVASALHCQLNDTISFVRKIYFYPDLPKSFQITQTDMAVGNMGYVQIGKKRIGITRVQIEEDPAKIIRENEYTLLDFNRSGIGLIEIVSEPDMASEDEMREFLIELRSILYYLGINIDQELKADLNVSIAGDRVETKNVTGMSNIVNALRYESKRQEELIAKNQIPKRETRSYSEAEMKTVPSREKETEEEYGFIYEPDLTDYDARRVKVKEPIYASMVAKEYAENYKYSEATLKELIMFSRESLALIDAAKDEHEMKSVVSAVELAAKYGKLDMGPENFKKIVALVEEKALVNKETIENIEKGKKLSSYSEADAEQVNKEIVDIIKSNSKLLEDYKKDEKVLNFVIGKVAKKYNVDPRYVAGQLKKVLKKEFGIG